MTTVSIKEAKDRFTQLVREAEKGETITVTRNGEPVAELVAAKAKTRGPNFAALEAWKRAHGVDKIVGEIPEDFDAPLPEDFLIRPLPA